MHAWLRSARRALAAHIPVRQRQQIRLALRAAHHALLRISGLPSGYQRWCARVEPTAAQLDTLRAQEAQRADAWRFAVVMPVYAPDVSQLTDAIDSVRAQTCPHWTLCIANDGSPDPAVAAFLDAQARMDARIRVTHRAHNGGIAAATADALALDDAPFIALLDQDDRLAPWALSFVARALDAAPDAGLLYSDEDKVSEDGVRHTPFFKPDWNPDLLYAVNYFCHLLILRRSVLDAAGGFRPGYDGAQDYDVALRCTAQLPPSQIIHIPAVLYHWRTARGSTAASSDAKPYAHQAGLAALRARFGLPVEDGAQPTSYRVRWPLPEVLPKISILVPTRDGGARLHKCMTQLLGLTDYPDIELLLIDNQSRDPYTLAVLDALRADARVRVLRHDQPFNFSAINNTAAAQASGDVLLLLNDDVEVLHADWLREMLAQLLQPGVGAVGAKLYYPDGRIQHGGVVLGIGGTAGHAHKYFPRHHPGYGGRLRLPQTVSAVTGACLLTRKRDFDAIGGLDAAHLAVAFNDVDYCLKLGARGLRTVWTPYAELIHHESASRGADDTPEKRRRLAREACVMQKRWGAQLQDDPCYNPSLTLKAEGFSIRTDAQPYLQRTLSRRSAGSIGGRG